MKTTATKIHHAFAAFVLVIFALCPLALAVTPAPDGGYPGGNTAEGQAALFSLTTGGFNTANGWFSLRANMTGSFNTAIGAGALLVNTADSNTGTGAGALLSNTTGHSNTADGAVALAHNIDGTYNTANGAYALFSNVSGANNTASGYEALYSNTGSFNTANGVFALYSNTTGAQNTADGVGALSNNTTGSRNIALGYDAGINVTTSDAVICIGSPGADVSGGCFIGNIRGVMTHLNNAVPVVIDSDGQVGTISSSRRFKKDVKPMDNASEAILALNPVTFHYKSDKTNRPEFGLIAEEVARVNPDLVVRDKNGEIYTVRYDAVNAMLLNEFLKEYRTVQELKSAAAKQGAAMINLKSTLEMRKELIARQQKEMELLKAQLKLNAAEIEKVTAKIEVSNASSKMTVNNLHAGDGD